MKPKYKIISIISVVAFFFFLGVSFYIPRTQYKDNRIVTLIVIILTMTPALIASYIGLFKSYKKNES